MAFNEYKRTASTPQNYKFNQGMGDVTFLTERVPELGVDLTKRRAYDYAIGRFWQIDPLADAAAQESLTPYQYSFNNPILYNDPLGEMPPCCGGSRPARRGGRSALRANIRRTVSEASAINRMPNGFASLSPRQGAMFTRTTRFSTSRGNGTAVGGTGNVGHTNDTHEMGNTSGNTSKVLGEIIGTAKKIVEKSGTITKVESFTESGVGEKSLGFDIIVGDASSTAELMQLQQGFSDEIMKTAQGDLTDEEFANADDRGARILKASLAAGPSPLQIAIEAMNSGTEEETTERRLPQVSASN